MKWNVLSAIIIACLFVAEATFAAVLVDGRPNGSSTPFDAYCDVVHNCQTFSEWYVENKLVSKEREQEIIGQFTEASKHFFAGQDQQAEQLFNALADKKFDADWSEKSKPFMVEAFLRSAQMESDAGVQFELARAAFYFDPWHNPDPSRYEPGLRTLHRKSSQQASWHELSTLALRSDFRFLVLNGRKFDLREVNSIRLPEGKYRATLISDRFAPLTKILDSRKLATWKISKKPLTKGVCGQPAPFVSTELKQIEELKIFFSENCIQNYNQPLLPAKKINLKLTKSPQIFDESLRHNLPIASATVNAKKPRWLWWVAGAMAGVWVISQSQSDSNPRPVQHEKY